MKRIMVVDDETTVRKSVRLVLESEGYTVSEATNADECWGKLQKEEVDLILLDVRMPGMPSSELIGKIKKDSKLKKIKIIHLTAIEGAKTASEKLENVSEIIEKPFNNHNLLNVVKKILS